MITDTDQIRHFQRNDTVACNRNFFLGIFFLQIIPILCSERPEKELTVCHMYVLRDSFPFIGPLWAILQLPAQIYGLRKAACFTTARGYPALIHVM